MGPRRAQNHVEDHHQRDADGQHPQRFDGVVGHHAVVHVHGEKRHRHGEDVDQQGRDQRVAVQAAVFHDGGPEPMALAHLGDFRRAGVEAELRAHEADQAAVLRGEFVGVHFDGAAAQFGVADDELAAIPFQQQAGAFAFQQQDGGQQVLGNLVQRALDHARGKLRPRSGAGQQGGCQTVLFQGKARRQSLRGGRDPMQPGNFNQAVEQGVVVRGAGVRAPFPARQVR
ncbi:hypothetical protein D3C72_1455390 [compost metagenome]